ncbi:MAG: M48 family metallopeptidase [Pseudomonadota bacterium]
MPSFALALACAAMLAACATTTSSTGRRQYVGAYSQAQLDQLGTRAFEEQKAKKLLTQDAKQTAYVRCVVDAIARELPPQWNRYAWESAVFVDKNPNAFALPGGKVGVYTGIFDVARNQNQMAAVIGHEIGHVIERHHDERVTRHVGAAGAVQLLAVLAGARYGQGGSDLASQGGSIIAQAGFLLPGTRKQEDEADIVGQRLMAQAGFDPRQAVELWQNMLASGGARPPEWLSTHPDPTSRIGEMRKRADSLVPVYEQARAAGRKPTCG